MSTQTSRGMPLELPSEAGAAATVAAVVEAGFDAVAAEDVAGGAADPVAPGAAMVTG